MSEDWKPFAKSYKNDWKSFAKSYENVPKLMPVTILEPSRGHPGHHRAFYSKTLKGDPSFWRGLWVAFAPQGLPKASAMPFGRTFSETILNQQSEKRHPKRHPKIDAEKTLKKYAKRLPK